MRCRCNRRQDKPPLNRFKTDECLDLVLGIIGIAGRIIAAFQVGFLGIEMVIGKIAGIRQPPAEKGEKNQKRENPVFEDALGHVSSFRLFNCYLKMKFRF